MSGQILRWGCCLLLLCCAAAAIDTSETSSLNTPNAGPLHTSRRMLQTGCSPGCSPGKCNTTAGAGVCSECKSGFQRSRVGSCVCPASTYATLTNPIEATQCAQCPMGFYCPGGFSSPNDPARLVACPAGMSTTAVGQRSLINCVNAPGFYFVNQTLALPCPKGTYSAGLVRQRSCQGCKRGFTTSSTGNVAISSCVLSPGYYLAALGMAVACPVTSWSAGGDLTTIACTPCPTGLTSNRTASSAPTDCRFTAQGYAALFEPRGTLRSAVPYAVRLCEVGTLCAGGFDTTQGDVPLGSDTGIIGCPEARSTRGLGSWMESQCVVPPGYYLRASSVSPGAKVMDKCPAGSYKAGWSASEACIACGTGILTRLNTSLAWPYYRNWNETRAIVQTEFVSSSPSECYVDPGTTILAVQSTSGERTYAAQVCSAVNVSCGTVKDASGRSVQWTCGEYITDSVQGLVNIPCQLCKSKQAGRYQGADGRTDGGFTACVLAAGQAAVSATGRIFYSPIPNGWKDVGSTTPCPIGYKCPEGDPTSVGPVVCGGQLTTQSAGSTPESHCATCDELFPVPPGSAALVVPAADGPRLCQCAFGFYADLDAQGSVTSHVDGNLKCVPCQPGYFKNFVGGACRACVVGMYANTAGSTVCATCGPGRTTKTIGSAAASDCGTCAQLFPNSQPISTGSRTCQCAPGFSQGNTSHAAGNLTCTPCPGSIGTGGQPGQATCGCPAWCDTTGSGNATMCTNCDAPLAPTNVFLNATTMTLNWQYDSRVNPATVLIVTCAANRGVCDQSFNVVVKRFPITWTSVPISTLGLSSNQNYNCYVASVRDTSQPKLSRCSTTYAAVA